MFDPDGWMPVPYIVTWLAGLGREGKLPRYLGFVHPGDVANPLDLSAEATARHVLVGKLAAGILSSVAIFDPSGLRVPVPAYYWSSGSAAATMETANFDLSVIGLQNDLHMAVVFLNIDEVAAALGFRLIPPTEAPAVPVQPADPPLYRALHIYLAQPTLLLAGAAEIHHDDAVLQELRRALEAGEIRNRIVVGAAYLPPLAGLISGQIVGELWRSDSVNYASGVLEHPPGVSRVIEICEEDAEAHFRAWSRQKQSPAPQPEALVEPPEPPTPAATPPGPELTSAVTAAQPKQEWRPGDAPKNYPERIAQVLYYLHQSNEINVAARPSAYDMPAKVMRKLQREERVPIATFNRGLRLARKAIATSC